jgi:hypothetical protein
LTSDEELEPYWREGDPMSGLCRSLDEALADALPVYGVHVRFAEQTLLFVIDSVEGR